MTVITIKSGLKTKLVPIKDLFIDDSQGIDLKRSNDFATDLRKKGGYFPPLFCIQVGKRYKIKEGHHRYLAYLSLTYKDCWMTFIPEGKVVK